ncbi:MAG: hypothetical protein K6U12_06070 [Armatimonadetes bacterium]|nr:hypothetical protein [Armatimonadota bacterium]CUU34795.1 hypothetical protein DCOP10_11117 [Armatimonadetes bacterium DC]
MNPVSRAQRREAFYRRVVDFYRQAGYAPPSPQEASRALGAPPDAIRAMLNWGIERGEIVESEGLYFATDALRQLHAQLQNLTPPYKVQQVRDLTGTSRRYAHAMLTALRQLGYI